MNEQFESGSVRSTTGTHTCLCQPTLQRPPVCLLFLPVFPLNFLGCFDQELTKMAPHVSGGLLYAPKSGFWSNLRTIYEASHMFGHLYAGLIIQN